MMYGYLVVEGPHDVEFIYRLLSPLGFKRIRLETDLDAFFKPLIPTTFPHAGDLQKRMPVPLFLQSPTHALAIQSAIGDTRLSSTVQEDSTVIDFDRFVGIGVFLDSDRQLEVVARYDALKDKMKSIGFSFPDTPGKVLLGNTRYGAFVLPDNNKMGNLEDLLIESAEAVYPRLLSQAVALVNFASSDEISASENNDGEDLKKPSMRNKAIVGAVANILRPGKAIQTSIQDNKWFKGDRLNTASIRCVQSFLKELFFIN